MVSASNRRNLQILVGLSAAAAAWLVQRRLTEPAPTSHRRQVVLITGAAGGLGMALARRYARADARLILNGLDPAKLHKAKATLLEEGTIKAPADCLVLPADLTRKDEVAAMLDRAFGHFERIDVLINVAGIIEVGPIEDQTVEAFEKVMQTNFFSALYTTMAALPRLLTQRPLDPEGPRSRHRASIVNISSIGGKMAVPHLLPYTASKFALTGLSEGLHAEVRAKGIRVTTVCPGLMRTGGENHARFVGNIAKERAWFLMSAKTPILAASVTHSADRIFHAQQRGAAEITITPQAWLAARLTGIAPGSVAIASSLVNHYLLPAPTHTT